MTRLLRAGVLLVVAGWSTVGLADPTALQAAYADYDRLLADAVLGATTRSTAALAMAVPANTVAPGQRLQLQLADGEVLSWADSQQSRWITLPSAPHRQDWQASLLAADGRVLQTSRVTVDAGTQQLLLGTIDGQWRSRAWPSGPAPGVGDRILGALSFWNGVGPRRNEQPRSQAPIFVHIAQRCARGDVVAAVDALALAATFIAKDVPRDNSILMSLLPCSRSLGSVEPLALLVDGALLDLPHASLALERGMPRRAVAHTDTARPKNNDWAAWLDVRSRALMALGRHTEAAELLARGPHLQLSEAWLADTRWEDAEQIRLDTLRVNYGIALLNTGQAAAGRAALDVVGRRASGRLSNNPLADQANLLLGWQFLREQRGGEAAAVFERIDLNTAQANAGLLGRGWAVLAGNKPAADRVVLPGLEAGGMSSQALLSLHRAGAIGCHELRAVSLDYTGECISKAGFEQVKFSKDLALRAQDAVRYWSALSTHPLHWAQWAEGQMAAADAFMAGSRPDIARQLLGDAVQRLDALGESASGLAAVVPGLPAKAGTNAECEAAACLVQQWMRESPLFRLQHSVTVLEALAASVGNTDQRTVEINALRNRFVDLIDVKLSERLRAHRAAVLEYERLARLKLARAYDQPYALSGRYEVLLESH